MTWFPLWYLYIHNTKICLSLSIVHLSIYFFIGNAAVGLSFGQRFTKSYTSMLQYQSICLFSVLHNIVCVFGSSRRITWPTLGKHIMYIHTLCLGCTGFPIILELSAVMSYIGGLARTLYIWYIHTGWSEKIPESLKGQSK